MSYGTKGGGGSTTLQRPLPPVRETRPIHRFLRANFFFLACPIRHPTPLHSTQSTQLSFSLPTSTPYAQSLSLSLSITFLPPLFFIPSLPPTRFILPLQFYLSLSFPTPPPPPNNRVSKESMLQHVKRWRTRPYKIFMFRPPPLHLSPKYKMSALGRHKD